MLDDTPKIWLEDEEEQTENLLPAENPEEEALPLPTKAEQLNIINTAELTQENKSLLAQLTEMNEVANTLMQLRDNETTEQRKTLIRAWSETFMAKRLQNNNAAEDLKKRLLKRLIDNVDQLDLETTSRIYNDIQEVTSVDAQTAMSQIMGGTNGGMLGGTSGTNITVNVANGDNSAATSNSMSVGGGPGINQLKEVAAMNSNISAWNSVEMPRKEKNVTETIDTSTDNNTKGETNDSES